MGTRFSRYASIAAIAVFALSNLGIDSCNSVIVVRNGESIQDAVDMAQPGDTIIVRLGTYTAPAGADAVVTIMTDDITLIGNPNAVIEADGVTFGVQVGTRQGGCLLGLVENFKIEGFTIQNADDTGLLIANVDGYSATGGRYLNNEEYGPFPVCSTDGYVAFNFASGHNDAAIYVGQSDGALIEFNSVVDSVIGVEIENSANCVVRKNMMKRNTAGILVVVLPGLNIAATENVLIEGNLIHDNNKANTGGGFLTLLPVGTGILNVGGDDVVIQNNNIKGNDTVGVASVGNAFAFVDPRIEPFVDNLAVRDNVIQENGTDPDPVSFVPGADIAFAADVVDPNTGTLLLPDPDPTDNCFANNIFDTEFVLATALGAPTLADFPCP